jgi:hypothetical protein
VAELVFTDNPGSLPATYTLAPSQALAVEAVRASIDGTSAAGSFYPCLSVYSQDGKLIGRVRTPTTYSAGDTGEVTWAPFLAEATTSTPASSGLQWVRGFASSSVTVTSGLVQNLNFTSVYQSPGQTAWSVVNTGTNPFRVALDGWYAVYLWVSWNSTAFTDVRTLSFNSTASIPGAGPNPTAIDTSSPYSGEQTVTNPAWPLSPVADGSTNDISFKAYQTSGSNKTITLRHCGMVYLGAVPDFFTT